jgi:Zn finger protein HypA/HybF involved in hydrogenase expression
MPEGRCDAEVRMNHAIARVRVRVKVVCLDCGHKWAVSPTASPECPRCGNTDFEVCEP